MNRGSLSSLPIFEQILQVNEVKKEGDIRGSGANPKA